jgi:hypothetical protein
VIKDLKIAVHLTKKDGKLAEEETENVAHEHVHLQVTKKEL